MKKKGIYCLQVLERDTETEKRVPIFSSEFPEIKATKARMVKKRKHLEKLIRLSKLKDYEKEALINRIWFILDRWYPNHFYRIVINPIN